MFFSPLQHVLLPGQEDDGSLQPRYVKEQKKEEGSTMMKERRVTKEALKLAETKGPLCSHLGMGSGKNLREKYRCCQRGAGAGDRGRMTKDLF